MQEPDKGTGIRSLVFNIKKFKDPACLQVDAVFERNDCNHDGKLTRKEFEDFMSHQNKHH